MPIWTLAVILSGLLSPIGSTFAGEAPAAPAVSGAVAQTTDPLELGRRMYMEGILPSGQTMSGVVKGDVPITGAQVICGTCHRRSGMGSTEGQEVMPAVTGKMLYEPLRTPTSKPPLAPERRPAYTDATLKRAIREGIGAAGAPLDPLMPRYGLSDEDLDLLLGYLKTLSAAPSPGVDERDIHFATIVSDAVPKPARKAMLDVMTAYFDQKNVETRHETTRAEHAPWHKAWMLEPYRKWVLHVWTLEGASETWPAQLEALYRQQPVFAVLNGIAPGSWKPIHAFCESTRLPCLFPTTDLPVLAGQDFYSLYLSGGMELQGRAVARHLHDEGLDSKPLLQVYRGGNARAETAAAGLAQAAQERAVAIRTTPVEGTGLAAADWQRMFEEGQESTAALWLSADDLQEFWSYLGSGSGPERVYLSTTLFGGRFDTVPPAVRDRVYFVHPYALPSDLPQRLARSTGWFLAKDIYAPGEQLVQANAYFALKLAGDALRMIRGYFYRDYFIERIEHMLDNVPYTSVYPRVSLAPKQRHVAKGCFIARVSAGDKADLVAVTDWLVP